MGLLDFVLGKKCPICGRRGARVVAGRTLCRNRACPDFYQAAPPGRRRDSPGKPVSIRYRNFKGEEKAFVADSASLQRSGNHISAIVAPKAIRISLARSRIQNLAEVESLLQPRPAREAWPSLKERQVLAFHKKYKTTSPLYQKLRAKYPEW